MKNNLWTKFIKRIPVKANREQIYRAWATQEGFEKWFLRKAEFTSVENKLKSDESLVEKGDNFNGSGTTTPIRYLSRDMYWKPMKRNFAGYNKLL